jgi:hypothetical protein
MDGFSLGFVIILIMYTPSDSHEMPEKLKQIFDDYEAGGIHTMKELLELALQVIDTADATPKCYPAAADSLAFYFDDYSRFHKDTDLYVMRYDRLFDAIIDACKKVIEPGRESLEHTWTKLKWLVEDQSKIIS